MSAFGSPVASPNPVGTGLSTLSDLMNVKRSQQALQIGQNTLQSTTAEAQQATQRNQELQALAAFTRQASQDPAYHNPDGSLNVQKFQNDASAKAPTYGQAYIGQMTSNANAMVDNRKALLGLSNEQRRTIGGYFGAVAANPNATPNDFVDAADSARAVSDDPGYQRAIDRMLMSAPPTATLPTAQASAVIRQHARGIAMQTGAPNVDQSTPNVQMVQTTAGQTPTNINPQSPAGTGPVGAAIPKPPESIPGPGGQILNRNPQTGGLSAPPIAGGPAGSSAGNPGINPTRAQAENVQGMATDDAGRYAQISQEGTNARTGAVLSDQVASLAEQVRTGKLSKEWTDRLAVLQQHDPTITARQMLSKYAAQLKTMATSGATTDASRSQIDEGMPSPETMNPDAVKEAAQYVGGIFRMRGARQAVADQYTKTNGNSIGIRAADDAFMQSADPTVFTYKSLPAGPERQDFLRKHGLTNQAAIDSFRARLNQVNHFSGQQ